MRFWDAVPSCSSSNIVRIFSTGLARRFLREGCAYGWSALIGCEHGYSEGAISFEDAFVQLFLSLQQRRLGYPFEGRSSLL